MLKVCLLKLPVDKRLQMKFTAFHDDFDSGVLEAQLRILHSVILREADIVYVNRPLTVKSIAEKLKTTTLLDAVWRLTKLLYLLYQLLQQQPNGAFQLCVA